MNEIKCYFVFMEEAAVAEQKEDWIGKHQDMGFCIRVDGTLSSELLRQSSHYKILSLQRPAITTPHTHTHTMLRS